MRRPGTGAARRTSLRGIGAAAAASPLSYVTGFVAATNYINGTGVAGTDAFTFWAIIVPRGGYSAIGTIAGKHAGTTPSTAGWALSVSAAGAVSAIMRDGVGTKVTPTSSIASDTGKAVMVHGVIDVANTVIRLYRAGVEVGSGTTTSGSLVTSANAQGIGSRNGGSVSVGSVLDIAGHGSVDVVMTPAEIAAHYAACQAAAACIAPSVSGTIRNWDARDYAASWLDDVAAAVMTTTGTITAGTLASPVWA